MRYWDTSAVVPLLVSEEASHAVLGEYEHDTEMLVWWATEVECASALARLESEGALAPPAAADAFDRLAALAASWLEVQPVAVVRRTAVRLLRVHSLRAADALQLAAAVVASENDPASLPLVTFDERLARAAQKEGFPVTRPEPT